MKLRQKVVKNGSSGHPWRVLGLFMCLLVLVGTVGCETLPPPVEPEEEAPPPEISTPKDLGKALLAEILKHFQFVKDPDVVRLVNQTGRKLVKAAGSNPDAYHFFVVQDPQLNAFAIPGGYIFIFNGLLGQIDSMDELAGVLAHEIAHVENDHFFKDQRKVMAMELATIAAILLGGPEAAIMAQVASQNIQLQYSRANEEEADAAGIVYLRQAGYAPQGLLRFFETLAAYERFNPPLLPSYFSTHPGVQDRLRIASVLLGGAEGDLSPAGDAAQAVDWERTAVVLRSLLEEPERTMEDLKRMVLKVGGEDAPADRRHYLLGLALLTTDQIARAADEYREAVRLGPDHAEYHAGLAFCYLRLKKMDLAGKEAERSIELSPRIPLAYLTLGMVRAMEGNPAAAVHHYQEGLSIAPDDLRLHWNLGQSYLKTGEKLLGAYHLGRYARLNLDPEQAVRHFEYAQDLTEEGSPMAQNIEREIREILEEGI